MYRDDPIDEVDLPQITAAEVERLVDDWLRRLDDLFAAIKAWATANGWSVEQALIAMLEEPMQRVGVAPRRQPSLTLRSPEGAEVWIKPKALWVPTVASTSIRAKACSR